MPCRQTEYAKRERLAIILRLGGVCAHCGENDLEQLEIDHINGRSWVLKAYSSSARVARYKREEKRGKLQVLCGRCNKAKYHRERESAPEGLDVDEIWNTEAQAA